MKRSKTEVLEGFEQISRYFDSFSNHNPYFMPEFEASTKVISIIQRNEVGKTALDEIVKVFNQVTEQQHYNGSGWYDFQIRIMYLIHECGFEAYHDGDKIGIKEKENDNG
jgi:hypothetical protein